MARDFNIQPAFTTAALDGGETRHVAMKAGMFYGLGMLDPDVYGDTYQLFGTIGDARDTATAFANMGYDCRARFSGVNVAGESVPWIATKDATLARWQADQCDLQTICKPGDWVVMGFSGHGSTTGPGLIHHETICLYDGQFSDVDQHALYCCWKAGVNVIYIYDCCYSGGMDRAALARPKRLPLTAPKLTETRQKGGTPLANIVLLCASQVSETAGDGPFNGCFSGSLLSVWAGMWDAGAVITLRGWFDATAGLMSSAFPSQHPVLMTLGGGDKILDLPLR